MDLENGFWLIRRNEKVRERITFVTPFGIFEWLVMPFGLCNAPATFQNFVQGFFDPFRSVTAELLYDIATLGDTIEELHTRLLLILSPFVSYGLLLNASKCRTFFKIGVFLAFLVSEHGITADPEKTTSTYSF